MDRTENRCEHLRTEMLTRVFDLIYGTFWAARFSRERYAKQYVRIQVIVQRLAAALYEAPAPDGSSPRLIGAWVDRLAEEVERLCAQHCFSEGELADMRARVEELRQVVAQMAAHCAGMAEAETQ